MRRDIKNYSYIASILLQVFRRQFLSISPHVCRRKGCRNVGYFTSQRLGCDRYADIPPSNQFELRQSEW